MKNNVLQFGVKENRISKPTPEQFLKAAVARLNEDATMTNEIHFKLLELSTYNDIDEFEILDYELINDTLKLESKGKRQLNYLIDIISIIQDTCRKVIEAIESV